MTLARRLTSRSVLVPRLALAGIALGLQVGAAAAQTDRPVSLSTFGTSGLIDMPTAQSQPDGQMDLTTSLYGGVLRNTLTFQITPRLSGSFRYSTLKGFFGPGNDLYDRSFDLQYRLTDEGQYMPELAFGLRDFGGTGIFESEYLVATKQIRDNISVSGGIGWGRLGSFGGFDNPLGVLDSGFESRPKCCGVTGQLAFDRFFRGPAALFGGVSWQPNDRLDVKLEYSSDAYVQERARLGFEGNTPFNVAVGYRFDNGVEAQGYLLHGSELGFVLNYAFNPAHPAQPSGRESAPPPVAQRSAAASWGLDRLDPAPETTKNRVTAAMAVQDLDIDSLQISEDAVTVRLQNRTYDATPEALGRAARVLTQTLPPEIETFHILTVVNGVAVTEVTLHRSDLEELESAPDGSWQSYARADITDPGTNQTQGIIAGAYPDFNWSISPFLSPSLFDPDNPVRADFGAQASFSYSPSPGLIFSGSVRKTILGNRNTSTRLSNSVLPRVRSDVVLYDKQDDPEITYLTTEYFWRPGPDLFGRLTVGYLERMYGGVSTELLWKPTAGRLAFGAELNYVRQRAFESGLGFQDYEVLTGHGSVYYDFGGGYLGQVDVGRYLAGDYGATFSLDREFGNGFRVGAFFTLTDVSAKEFGEGSFDKGIRITIPVSWLSGDPSQNNFGTTIRPIYRDGGARLDIRNRLYEMVRNEQDPILRQRWGRFWR